ncbi:hypothetical protein K438DRAFT_1998592 [Mycena galopus ATCC 62051]|nr:hypothetical protein K438DRAFT_1998592 [Mycena galopus ATCC 62051]
MISLDGRALGSLLPEERQCRDGGSGSEASQGRAARLARVVRGLACRGAAAHERAQSSLWLCAAAKIPLRAGASCCFSRHAPPRDQTASVLGSGLGWSWSRMQAVAGHQAKGEGRAQARVRPKRSAYQVPATGFVSRRRSASITFMILLYKKTAVFVGVGVRDRDEGRAGTRRGCGSEPRVPLLSRRVLVLLLR